MTDWEALGFEGISFISSWFAYVVALVVIYRVAIFTYSYVNSLWVEGKPNEWVVIMRNGEFVQAGIGLSTVTTPFDTHAIFPSKLHKVEIKTQQVTKEMQGIEVSSMIEWTIDKKGEGPMKAFKNLDVHKHHPDKANETLRAMASAIVRNQIANSTIDEALKNRQGLREAVMTEMKEVVQGWGVHLSTVEVTDVKVCSHGLFKDMQTQFREQNTKKATLERLVVQTDLDEERLSHELEDHKRSWDTSKTQTTALNKQKIEKLKQGIINYEQQIELEKRKTERNNAQRLQDKEIQVQKTMKQLDVELIEKKASIATAIQNNVAGRELSAQQDAEHLAAVQEQIKNNSNEAATARKIKQANYDVLKASFKNPVQRKLQTMKILGEMHGSISFNNLKLNQMGDAEPVAEILEKFTRLAETDDVKAPVKGKK